MWNRKVFIRIVEVLLCIACVVALRVTDDESRRVFHYLRNRSREWSLLNNVTWGAIGAALATVTCGGYVIIAAGLLIAAATGELRGRKTEIFFLGLGIILFAIVGALSLASIESVPEDLVDNAAVLGALCLLTALVFIADLLMGTPKKKEKNVLAQGPMDKSAAKPQITTVAMEDDAKSGKTISAAKDSETKGKVSDANIVPEKPSDRLQRAANEERSEDFERTEVDRSRSFEHFEREYDQNFENGRVLRDSQRHRDAELQRSARDSYERGIEEPRMIYKMQDVYQRPVDEVDTPRFPTETVAREKPMFAKVVNPSVKIMKVERDVDDAQDYRYSDISQYDNVPTRMRGTSLGILKKHRDVSFNVPPPPKNYGNGRERSRDEIEMLEDCFDVLRTTSTGTQTGNRTPSSPTDPGYVRHTASNWPHETKAKTPRSSPDHG